MTLDPIPQARVVRKGGRLMTPPRRPRDDRDGMVGSKLREAAAIALGLWPLTAVLLAMLGLLVMAGNGNPYAR
jgi:hypothetical protein